MTLDESKVTLTRSFSRHDDQFWDLSQLCICNFLGAISINMYNESTLSTCSRDPIAFVGVKQENAI